jgi:hypothetical protein
VDDDDRVLQAIRPIYTDPRSRDLAQGIPVRLLLGWILVESSGQYQHLESTGEAGYFQIDSDGQRALGTTAATVIRSPQNSLHYGLRYVQLCKSGLQQALDDAQLTIDPNEDGLRERLTKLVHTVGLPSVRILLRKLARDVQQPVTWDSITKYWRKKANTLNSRTLQQPERMIGNVDRVMTQGARLAPRSIPPTPSRDAPAP